MNFVSVHDFFERINHGPWHINKGSYYCISLLVLLHIGKRESGKQGMQRTLNRKIIKRHQKEKQGAGSRKDGNLRSYPPSLHLIAGKEGMIHFIFGSHVQKLESGVFSDWSRNNTYDSLCSDWLSCFYETSGQKLVRRKQNA